MNRIKNWTEGVPAFGKLLLLALIVMALVFAVVYPVVAAREGYLYNDQILVPGTENGNTIYSAQVKGEQWRITVTPDKTVTFRCGEKEYGPYTAKIDPTAIPKGDDLAHRMTGVEVREGDDIRFRGGIFDTGSYWIMVNEDGTDASFTISAVGSGGTVLGPNGKIIDPMEPSVATVLKLMQGPELTHKGHGGFCFLGVFVSVIAAVQILFADELFRWHFIFRARNPEDIEPSDWELTIRPIAWTIMVAMALWVYIKGLQIII
jgi:hypothetical protein